MLYYFMKFWIICNLICIFISLQINPPLIKSYFLLASSTLAIKFDSRFYSIWTTISHMIPNLLFQQDLVEKLSKGDLPKNEYQCMNDPSPSFHGTSNNGSIRAIESHPAHSMRSRRTATWARPRASDDGYSR